MTRKEWSRPLGQGSGPKVTDATNAVDASTIADRGDSVVVDLAAERRRRRPAPPVAWFCPERYGAHRSAAVAELSASLGSLQAAYAHLDQQRAARQALADARRSAVVEAIERLSWSADQERRFREWLAAPLQVPAWVTVQGWPEPSGAAS